MTLRTPPPRARSDDTGSAYGKWSVVIPVAPFARWGHGKVPGTGVRAAQLAHCLFLDTLRAVRSTPQVGLVVVVTADPLAACQARALSAGIVVESEAEGPDPAVLRGVARLVADSPVAVLAADLPALRPAELTELLDRAATHRHTHVADPVGRRVTAFTARRARELQPLFGTNLPLQARAVGDRLEVPPESGLRLDVDTHADLARLTNRLGPYSAALAGVRRRAPRDVGASAPSLPTAPQLPCVPPPFTSLADSARGARD